MTAYRDIKDIIIGTTHKLDMVPVEVVSDLCGAYPHRIRSNYLVGWEYTNIECVTHAYMPSTHEPNYNDSADWSFIEMLHYVCTVLVDDTPALFFIHVRSDSWWEPETYTYILDVCACSILMTLITEDGWVCGQPMTEDEEVKELTEACGVRTQYGST